tara:strand:+ start:278 stop:1153 length:876 start_codon:yes stop_codon:yes gene_type:complete
MSEDYSAQAQPTQSWNTVRGVWEKQGIANLLCEHWELFSETWQTSGMMRNGKVYALQTLAHRTTDSEFSSLPTPIASEGTKASAAQSSKRRLETGQVFLTNIIHDVAVENGMPVPTGNLLLTPTAVEGNGAAKSEVNANDPKHRLKVATVVLARDGVNWGKFEPAIRRWEKTLGRSTPSPTKSDGKDGAHRLSSKFTEWMMGLPSGWVTDAGLTRNDELKACGNGVVPQQAEMALRSLLGSGTIAGNETQVNLPTPTVSDTYTGNLKSTQQKEGSMHSVTLPQAVGMVATK